MSVSVASASSYAISVKVAARLIISIISPIHSPLSCAISRRAYPAIINPIGNFGPDFYTISTPIFSVGEPLAENQQIHSLTMSNSRM